jgi:hypothetical protein
VLPLTPQRGHPHAVEGAEFEAGHVVRADEALILLTPEEENYSFKKYVQLAADGMLSLAARPVGAG